MRGQLEEAKHTVMRAAELEQQRRKAADEFKRDQQQASAFGYGQGSGESQQQQQQQQQQPARPLDFGGRPPPTRETLMEREKELSQLRAALDEAGNEVVANLRKYDEMYAQLDGLYGAEREQLTERLSKGHEYIEGLKAAADEKKAAVADMERRVAAIKDALAQLSATQQDSTYGPQSGAPAPYGGSSSHHQPPQQQQQSSSSGGSTRSGASAEAIQYALEEAEFVLREAKRRANDLEASFQDKERGLTQMRRDLADREQRKSLSSSSSYDYGGSGDRYGSGGADIEEQRRAAAMAAVEASYAARAAEERANMLRGSLDDKSGELEWMRSEHAKVVKQIADLESAANAAADTQRKVDAKASAIVEAQLRRRRMLACLSKAAEDASFTPVASLVSSAVMAPLSLVRLGLLAFPALSDRVEGGLTERLIQGGRGGVSSSSKGGMRTNFESPYPDDEAARLLATCLTDIGSDKRFAPLVVVPCRRHVLVFAFIFLVAFAFVCILSASASQVRLGLRARVHVRLHLRRR